MDIKNKLVVLLNIKRSEMKNPTKKQVQKVIDVLTKANEIAKNNAPVDMMQGYVHRDCGTPMCHAGWYLIGSGISGYYSYFTGANFIAKDLGFLCTDDLLLWAHKNPEIWGNKYGRRMFESRTAFQEDLTQLTQIIEHWKGVQERLPI